MAVFDILSSIFKGLMDPQTLAREMAQMGISPEELITQAKQAQQLAVMPTQTGSNANEQQQQNQPFSFGNLFKDLMAPTPPTAQAGQAGTALGKSLGQVGPDMDNIMQRIGSLLQPGGAPATGQAASVMQAGMPQGLPQMPQQLQGLPPQLYAGASQPPNAPPVAPPQALPTPPSASTPQSSLGLAMQPNTQPMQPNRPGIERPGAVPFMGKDATEVRDAAMKTFFSGGVTNPFGLAALASTGEHESGFNPANLARTWPDPSQSGGKGVSGGMFSWRNERLTALQEFAKSKGESGNGSPQTQAQFFMQEDPSTVKALNSAKSVDEAQSIMNKNIAFAGYNREGGEASRRLQTARTLVPQMQQLTGTPAAPVETSAINPQDTPVVPPTSGGSPGAPTAGNPFSFLDALDPNKGGNGDQIEMNLPKPPPPVAPQPGNFNVNPQTMQLMMALLGPMAGGAPMPSIAQLMGAR